MISEQSVTKKLDQYKPKYEKPKKKKTIETDLVDEVVETDIEVSE